jgi:hypothetical protein
MKLAIAFLTAMLFCTSVAHSQEADFDPTRGTTAAPRDPTGRPNPPISGGEAPRVDPSPLMDLLNQITRPRPPAPPIPTPPTRVPQPAGPGAPATATPVPVPPPTTIPPPPDRVPNSTRKTRGAGRAGSQATRASVCSTPSCVRSATATACTVIFGAVRRGQARSAVGRSSAYLRAAGATPGPRRQTGREHVAGRLMAVSRSASRRRRNGRHGGVAADATHRTHARGAVTGSAPRPRRRIMLGCRRIAC